jgi:hypothetical protein
VLPDWLGSARLAEEGPRLTGAAGLSSRKTLNQIAYTKKTWMARSSSAMTAPGKSLPGGSGFCLTVNPV